MLKTYLHGDKHITPCWKDSTVEKNFNQFYCLIMILGYKRNSKLQNMKKIIETAPDTHSQFHRNMAEFSDCVPPALKYVSRFHFTLGHFEFPLYPKIIIKQ